MTTVHISGLRFHAFHGVGEQERAEGREYVIDLSLSLSHCEAEITDEVRDTVDYGRVAEIAFEIASKCQFRTLERLAAKICDALLSEFALATEVQIEIGKLEPPTAVPIPRAGVKMTKTRA